MAVDRIVEEFWDEKIRGYRWIRESGTNTVVFQAQGLDIVIIQNREGKDHNAWCYSEPGLLIFAAMLKYHQQTMGRLPPLEEIQHMLGMQRDSMESGFPVDRISMSLILRDDFPVAEKGRILLKKNQALHIIGSYMGGIGYTGFIEDGTFVISAPDIGPEVGVFSQRDGEPRKIMSFNRSVILFPDCALRVMKAINHFYIDKEFLEGAYRQAEDPKEDWIYGD